MAKTLGIDLGTSSLGWAILDDEHLMNAPHGSEASSAIECGVVIFPEGMERDKSGALKSRAAERRSARAARRLIFRRKWRKILLLRLLAEKRMCPIAKESIEAWMRDDYPVNDKAFREWLAATPEKNPYIDRKRAAEEKVDPFTLGRALYHIAQRRGFKSSRKEQLQELEAESENKGRAKSGDLGPVKNEIAELTAAMGEKTLGQYFYELHKSGTKVRGRHIGRVEHYQAEFNRIAARQELPQDLADALRKILFSQRRLRAQSHLVGWCELEKRRKKYRRAVSSHPLYEAYAAWNFVNNIRVGEEDARRALTDAERKTAFELLKRRTSCTVGELLKALKKKTKDLPEGMSHREDASAPIMPVTARFESLELPPEEWQAAFNALLDFDDLGKLRDWAKARYGWDDGKAKDFLRTNPSEDRGRYSLHAIRKILPWLEKGYLNRKAVFLAKLPEVIRDFAAHEAEILAGLEREEEAYREEKRLQAEARAFRKVLPLEVGYWKRCLIANWGLDEDGFKRLYVSEDGYRPEKKLLDPVDLGSYRNPLVCRSLTILRRLVNRLRKEGKIDEMTRIHVELAHSVNSANECRAIELFNKDREKLRAEAVVELQSILASANLNVQVNDDLVLRYLLWQEQGRRSVYTGQPIGAEQMVKECDIEHTVPRSLGGTSRRENLTLCEAHYNRNIKKGLLPSECPNASDEWLDPAVGVKYPALEQSKVIVEWQERLKSLTQQLKRKPSRGGDPSAYNMARQKWLKTKMERDYLSAKLGFFKLSRERAEESGFIPRQLADTGAMTRRAIAYLQTRYKWVYPTNGTTTAFARKVWGLQREEAKDRSDHTHHAMDAMVIAALSRDNFQKICAYFKRHDADAVAPNVPPPYPNFAEQAHHALETILVRHVRENRLRKPYTAQSKRSAVRLAEQGGKVPSCGSTIRGTLHDATIYGRIVLPGTDECVTVVRKTIAAAANRAELEKWANDAVDPVVGMCLLAQMRAYVAQGVADKDLKAQSYWANRERGIALKKLRVKVSKPANPKVIREQVFKGSSDLKNKVYISGIPSLAMRGWKDPKGKWQTSLTNLLSLAQQKGEEGLTEPRTGEFVLCPGQLVLTYRDSPDELKHLTNKALAKRLYVVVQTVGETRGLFRYQREARSSTCLKSELPKMFNPETKKPLSPSGESRICFDEPIPLLLLSVSYFAEHMLFEGRDFLFTLDGEINWIER